WSLRAAAVFRRQRLDQAVDAARADLLAEFVAIVRDQRHAADDDVVGLPRALFLFHAVIDLHWRLTLADDFGANHDVGGARIGAQRLVVDRLVAILAQRSRVRAHEQRLEFDRQPLLLLRRRLAPVATHRQR